MSGVMVGGMRAVRTRRTLFLSRISARFVSQPAPSALTPLSSLSNSILYVRNLPFTITTDELYALFGKYGPLRQIRLGTAPNTKGSAFVVYEDIFDAASAAAALSGFNVGGRYLVVLFHSAARAAKRAAGAADAAALRALQAEHGVDGEQRGRG